jgi:hypothetical protein
MHIAYSFINEIKNNSQSNNKQQINKELAIRYEAFQSACNKYSDEIIAIQKYIPGWAPKFR